MQDVPNNVYILSILFFLTKLENFIVVITLSDLA